jgi:hypothetical protein
MDLLCTATDLRRDLAVVLLRSEISICGGRTGNTRPIATEKTPTGLPFSAASHPVPPHLYTAYSTCITQLTARVTDLLVRKEK